MNKKAAASSKLRLQVADDWGAERAGEPRNSNIHPLVFLHICPTGPSSLWSVMTLSYVHPLHLWKAIVKYCKDQLCTRYQQTK